MKRFTILAISAAIIISLVLGVFAAMYVTNGVTGDGLYQVSSLQALYDGKMGGVCSVGDLLWHGDTGIGTFDSLDGEMVVLGGVCYQVTSDGVVHVAPGGYTTPFATVAFFNADDAIQITSAVNYSTFIADAFSELPNPHSFYVVMIEATFSSLTLRSVPPAQQPYPPLSQVIANQTVFNYTDIKGTMVGIYSPAQAGSLSSPGFHFHFLSADAGKGGHVLDWNAPPMTVQLDLKENLTVDLLPY